MTETAVSAAQTTLFELQEFNETLVQWVRVSRFDGVSPATAEDIYRNKARYSDRYVRLIDANAPEGANVFYGSISENPVQSAKDDAMAPRDSWWSVDGRI